VMPSNAPASKKVAVQAYGGRVIECAPTLADRERTAGTIGSATGAEFIHPYNNERVIAGQGTAALEFLKDVPDLEVLLVPVGGGGLLAGTAVAVRGHGVKVIGTEPDGADDAARSFETGILQPAGTPLTIADGLRTALGDINFALIRAGVDDILTVSETGIVRAMRLVWERLKLVIEPSAAVPLGACLEHPERFAGQRIGIILSGGNVDLDTLPWNS